MNKQIDDLAKVLCKYHNTEKCFGCKDYGNCFVRLQAEWIWSEGYRKSTDVAMEIDDIRRYIILNENIAKKCKEENGEQNEEYWKGKLAAFLQIRGYIDTELKKKYESEGADDGLE